MARDYYAQLRNTLRTAHWRTDDIEMLRDAMPALLHRMDNRQKREQYGLLIDAYADFWSARNAEVAEVEPAAVRVAELRIRVAPEVGMITADDDQALKLWFNQDRPTRAYRQATQYMMDLAATRTWDNSWEPAIWNVREQNILGTLHLPADFVAGIEGQAASFLHIWHSISDSVFS